jgi:hypothetical protein
MAEGLNRMGLRLRNVLKAQPQKKIAETEAMLAHIKKRPGGHGLAQPQTLAYRL